MALSTAQPKLAANLEAHYQHLLTCPEEVDTRAHLPLFRSLSGSILEIGCDCGNSTTAFLAGKSSSVLSVDINPLCANNFPDSEKWKFVCGDSQQIETAKRVQSFAANWFDVLFVDGAHDYESAYNDIRLYSDLVDRGGLIFVHDVMAFDNFPGVYQAFREFEGHRVQAKYILPGSYGLGVIEL